MNKGPFDDWTDKEWEVFTETYPTGEKKREPNASVYLAYITERNKKEKFWLKYGNELLEKKKVTRSELEGAAIGVGSFDKELSEKLRTRKPTINLAKLK